MRSAVAQSQLGNRVAYSESSGVEKDHKEKIRNVLIVLIDTSLSLLLGKENGLSLFQETFVLIQPPNWKSINCPFP